MGSYLRQIKASDGLLSASRFPEMYDVVKKIASDPKWNDIGTSRSIMDTYDFRGACYKMGVILIPNGDDLFTVNVDGAYDSMLFTPLIEALAVYINNGEVEVSYDNGPSATRVTFIDGTVSYFDYFLTENINDE